MKCQELSETAEYAQNWPTVFHGLSVIANRITPAHLDNNGSWAWHDQILSIGTYNKATLVMEDLKATFDYSPGTVIQFSGSLLCHEVGKWDVGDRICYACFVKKGIFDGFKIAYPDFPYLGKLKQKVMDSGI